jgi:hypothetical protein
MEQQDSHIAEEDKKPFVNSRRQFLQLAGTSVAAGLLGLAGCSQAEPTPVEVLKTVEVTREVPVEKIVEVPQAIPDLPWKYVDLDVEQARKDGHAGYYEAECCYGAFHGVMKQLKEKVGFPLTQIPEHMVRFGGGGVAGWGTTCGTIIGAATAITLVVKIEDARTLIDQLMQYYSQTPLPTDQSNTYAVNHEFLVADKPDMALAQSVSSSPLCHASVTNWCEAAKVGSKTKERAERCGRLAGDIAAYTVELLNNYHAGSFIPVFDTNDETKACLTCHAAGEVFEAGQYTIGKMQCDTCHEPHEIKTP